VTIIIDDDDLIEAQFVNGLKVSSKRHSAVTAYQISKKGLALLRAFPHYEVLQSVCVSVCLIDVCITEIVNVCVCVLVQEYLNEMAPLIYCAHEQCASLEVCFFREMKPKPKPKPKPND
jgi:hypothetical protein